MTAYIIKPFEPAYREQMIDLWERSVRATHPFVDPRDIDHYKVLMQDVDFFSFDVFCMLEGKSVCGFLGTAGHRIEALFLDPDYIGKGLGRMFMDYAMNELQTDYVEVNEQNTNAVAFYEYFGFRTFDRTEKDGQGKDYPLLKMRLETA